MSELAADLITALAAKGWQLRCAESCTAGLITATLTDVSGASAVVDRGFVTYSNQAKQEMLNVQEATIATYGAVSAETAFEMVTGTYQINEDRGASLSVTGIAGPNGGSQDKPVGTVWIGTSIPDKEPVIAHYLFEGDREAVRQQTVEAALWQLRDMLNP